MLIFNQLSANVNMKQANQLNDQNKKVQLSEMPTEILEHILMHLDGEHLLNASHVCKLFASVAETAFARKYSNKCYQISKKSENSFHKIMLSKYGEKLRRLQIIENDDEDLLDLVEQKCYNLKSITRVKRCSKNDYVEGLERSYFERNTQFEPENICRIHQ